jgi:hypothetical protein
MVVALLTTALLIVNLHPEIWNVLLEERNLTLIAIGVSLTAIIVLLAIGGASLGWTGFGDKTLWDWLPSYLYSPECLEEAFSKIKRFLRRV